MKAIKRLGSGILSLATLFLCNVSNVFPKSKLADSIKTKIENSVYQNDKSAPEELVLEQSDVALGDQFGIDSSHTSHRSHSSHRSSSSGSAASRQPAAAPATTKSTSPSTAKPKTAAVAPSFGLSTVISPYATYLSVPEFERITGFAGTTRQEEQTALHFLRSDGIEMLQVRFEQAKYIDVFQGSSFSSIQGVGESAIMGVLPAPSFIVFKKGEHCVEITTYQEAGSKLFLSLGQLISIAKSIAPRL
jgi:hypothetical protein